MKTLPSQLACSVQRASAQFIRFVSVAVLAAVTTAPVVPTSAFAADAAPSGGMSRSEEVFDISKLDRLPEIKYRVDVQYPFAMRRAGITGEVVVEFILDTRGNVTNPIVIRSSQREFEANAVASVSKWKFRPGQKNGRDVNTRMQVPIVFTLNRE